MRLRGGVAIAAVGMLLALAGCSLAEDDGPAPPTALVEMTPADDTPWATDVWLPGSAFTISWPLAVSDSGDVLLQYSDDAASWADGVDPGETGLAIVTRSGEVTIIADPRIGGPADSVLGARLNGTTAVWSSSADGGEYVSAQHSQEVGYSLWFYDRVTGKLTPVRTVVTEGVAAGDDVGSGADFVLIEDTALWAAPVSGAGESHQPVAADPSGRVWLALVSSPKTGWMTVDQCRGDATVSIVGFPGADGQPPGLTYLEATLDADGMLQVDEESVFNLDLRREGFALFPGVVRCGDTIAGRVQWPKGAANTGKDFVTTTAPEREPHPTGIGATSIPVASYLTPDWLVVSVLDGVFTSRISILDRASAAVWNPGGLSGCGSRLEVAGSQIMWAEPAANLNDEQPVMGQCDTFVGWLRAP